MAMRRAGALLVIMATGAACRDLDSRTESARKRILALDAAEAAKIVAFCNSWHQDGALPVAQFPAALPIRPTSATAAAHVVTFAWWNNSHFEEDEPQPGFELICSERAVPNGRSIAPGLWYRDEPMNAGD